MRGAAPVGGLETAGGLCGYWGLVVQFYWATALVTALVAHLLLGPTQSAGFDLQSPVWPGTRIPTPIQSGSSPWVIWQGPVKRSITFQGKGDGGKKQGLLCRGTTALEYVSRGSSISPLCGALTM